MGLNEVVLIRHREREGTLGSLLTLTSEAARSNNIEELHVGKGPPLGQEGQGALEKGERSPGAVSEGAGVQADVGHVPGVVLLTASWCRECPHVSCGMPAVCAVLAHGAGGAGGRRPRGVRPPAQHH